MTVLSRRDRTAASRKATDAALRQATLDLLDEGRPFASLGIEAIVKRAGLSRPTFYAYFEDKRALVLALGRDVEADLAAVADPWLAGEGEDPRATLAAVLDVFRRHRPAVGAVVEAAAYDADVAAFWRGFHERFVPGARARIAAAAPALPDAQVAARASLLVWMTERSLVEHVAEPIADEDALLDQLSWFWTVATAAAGGPQAM